MQTRLTIIDGGWATVESVREMSKPGAEGELRLHELRGGTERVDGAHRRIRPGWWIEICRDGSWERHSGPFGWSQLNGAPPQEALDAVRKELGLPIISSAESPTPSPLGSSPTTGD